MLSQKILLKVTALRGVWRRGGVVSVFCSLLLAGGLTVGASPVSAQLPDRVEDYWASSAELVWRGTQALKTCYGLFLSNRTLDQIHEKELMGLRPHGPMDRDRVAINYRAKTVEVGVGQVDFVAPMKSAYREGIGCVVMAPHQNFIDDLEGLPSLELPPFPGDAATIAWPDGDRVENKPLPAGVNQAALDAAGDWAFDRIVHGGHQGQVTTGMMVVYQGDLIYERYAPGFDMHTATRMWSSAKGLVSTLFGIAVDKGILEMDEPIPVAWPHGSHVPAQSDPRRKITLRHLLNMSSGLYSMDREYNWMRGSHMVYFGGWDGGYQHRDRGLVAEPGTYYNYQNGDAVIPIMALRNALDEKTYKEFPHVELLRKIGMRDTTPGMDRYGNYLMNSQTYSTPRDMARMGLLYLNRGRWNGEQILSEDFVDFVRTPAPADPDQEYGGLFRLVPSDRTDLPQDAYAATGAQGQSTIIVPSHDLVIVRRGLDWRQGSPGGGIGTWNILEEVLKAFPPRAGGRKLTLAADE